MPEAVIVDSVRTPFGRRNGWLAGLHPTQILAAAKQGVLSRLGVDPASVGQVIGGCVTQAGEQSNDAVRRAWLYAGLPQATAGTSLDAQCGSGQQAAHLVNDMVAAGSIDVGIACGVEMMSRIPLGANVPPGMGDPRPDDWSIDMPNQFEAADRIANHRGISRSDLEVLGADPDERAHGLARAALVARPFVGKGAAGGTRATGAHAALGEQGVEHGNKPILVLGGKVEVATASMQS